MLTLGRLSRGGEVHQERGTEAPDPSPDGAACICVSRSVLPGSVHVASLQGLSYEHRIPSAVLFQALGSSTLPSLDRRGLRAQEAIRVRSSNQLTSILPKSALWACPCPSLPWGFWGLVSGQVGHRDCLWPRADRGGPPRLPFQSVGSPRWGLREPRCAPVGIKGISSDRFAVDSSLYAHG